MSLSKSRSIRILDVEVANKIAAGEVIERPASVVKELVENAIDAGANDIRIEARGGGLQLIRVTDNGWGMSQDEAEICLQRHATSKIETADDLFKIETLGFRGEALPSITAVSKFTVLTRRQSEEIGTLIVAENGRITERSKRGCPEGTSMAAQNLFINLPARLKYMKSASTEFSHISSLVSQFALAYPALRFTLASDGRTVFQSIGDGTLFSALVRVYGISTAEAMFEVRSETGSKSKVKVWGFVGGPGISRSNRNALSFFVNRRWVQSRSLAFAVEDACRPILPEGRRPLAVINIEVPPDEIDVNVHPTKSEVRFLKDREVFVSVQDAVRRALSDAVAMASIIEKPTFALPNIEHRLEAAGQAFAPTPLPFPHSTFSPAPWRAPEQSIEDRQSINTFTNSTDRPVDRRLPMLRVIGQMGCTFIIAEGPTGMFLVDQHRAHERVLFDHLTKERSEAKATSQMLLAPVVIDLSPAQAEILATRTEDLSRLGFTVEAFGEHSFLVREVPAALGLANASEAVGEIIEEAVRGGDTSDWNQLLLATIACKGAIKAGQALTALEMRELLLQLEAATIPSICPHGAPIMVHLSQAQLEKQFGR